MTVNNEYLNNFGESLMNMWSNNLDKVFTSQKEVENLLLQAFTGQKESLEKIVGNIESIQAEQKQVIAEVREYVNQNLQKFYGEDASKTFEKWNAQLDEMNSRIQNLASPSFKESLDVLNQSQEQIQHSIKNSFDQQKKYYEESINQFKSAQKGLMDLFETNTKAALNMFK